MEGSDEPDFQARRSGQNAMAVSGLRSKGSQNEPEPSERKNQNDEEIEEADALKVKVRAHDDAGDKRGQPSAAEEPAKNRSAVKKNAPDPNDDRNKNGTARDVESAKLVKSQREAIPSIGHYDIA